MIAAPHYDSEYDDSLAESLAAEFSAELASVLFEGNTLTAPVYAQLRWEIAQLVRNRTSCLALFECETVALTDIRDALGDLHNEPDDLAVCPSQRWTTDALLVGWEQLQDLRQCDEFAVDRQRPAATNHVRDCFEVSSALDDDYLRTTSVCVQVPAR